MSYTPNIENRIIIKRPEELSGTLRSDVQYIIDGELDMGTTEITIPSGGLAIGGLGFNISKIYSTEDNYTMFKTNVDSGGGAFDNIELSASGTSSKLFNIDNAGNSSAVEFLDCNIGSFSRTTTSFGNIDNYRQFRFQGCGFINYSDGFTLNGTFAGGIAVTDSIILSAQSGSTLFKEGTSFVMNGSSTSNINASSGSNNANIEVWDFQPSNVSNDGQFVLDGARFGNLTNPVPNMPESSTKAFYRDCVGINNTRPGAVMEWTSQTITLLTANVPTKGLGTTTITDEIWFSQTGSNEITYLSTLTKDIEISVNLRIDGGPNDEVSVIVRKYDDSITSYVDVKTKTLPINSLVSGLDIQDYNFIARTDIDVDDRIEVWVENTSDGTDITIQNGSEVFIKVI